MSSTGAGLAAKIAQNCRRWDRICRERCGARCICILVCRREDAYGFTMVKGEPFWSSRPHGASFRWSS